MLSFFYACKSPYSLKHPRNVKDQYQRLTWAYVCVDRASNVACDIRKSSTPQSVCRWLERQLEYTMLSGQGSRSWLHLNVLPCQRLRQATSRIDLLSFKIVVWEGNICMTTQAEVSDRVVRYEDVSIAGTSNHRRLSSRRRRIVGEQAIQHLAFWELRVSCE